MGALFQIVFVALDALSRLTGLTYEEINIVVYYALVPLVFAHLLDRIIHRHVFVVSVVIGLVTALGFIPDFESFSETLFDASVGFLKSFSVVGWNYVTASVIVCLIAPLALFLVMLRFAYPGWLSRHFPTVRRAVTRFMPHATSDRG
jgi:hypothetical protein